MKYNINELNNYLQSNNQILRILSITRQQYKPLVCILNNGHVIYRNELQKLLKYTTLLTPFMYNKNFFDLIFSHEEHIRTDNIKKYRSFASSFGAKQTWLISGEKIKSKLKGRTAYNKGKKRLTPNWNEGLTKHNNESMMRISLSKMGENNPMYGKFMSKEDKETKSIMMKTKIKNGEFTPNSNNRHTHFDCMYKGKKYRSSWEAAFIYLNPTCIYEKIRIEYIDENNKERIYIIDFVDEINKILYEIKPTSLIKDLKYKIEGVNTWLLSNVGYKYVIISEAYIKENLQKILESDLSDEIKNKILKSKL